MVHKFYVNHMLVKFEENTVGFDEVPGGYFSHPKPLLGLVITWIGHKLCKMHQTHMACIVFKKTLLVLMNYPVVIFSQWLIDS